MAFGQAHPRFQVHEVPGGIVVELPSPRRLLAATIVGLWLAGWAVGLSFALQQLLAGEGRGPDRVFLVVWSIAWFAAGAYAAAYLAWLLAGHERITLRAGRLRIWRGVAAVGYACEYPLAAVHELRTFGRDLVPLLAAGLDLAGQGASGVRFQCGGRVVRFARALEEHEAHALVDRLRAAHAFDARDQTPAEPAAQAG